MTTTSSSSRIHVIGTAGLAIALLLVLPVVASAFELHNHRGAKQNGVADGSLANKLKPAWSQKIGSSISGSPVIVDGVIYIGADDGTVSALKSSDGSQVWTFAADGGIGDSVIFVDGQIIFATTMSSLYSLDAKTGKQIWNSTVDGDVVGGANVVAGSDGNKVVVVGSHDNNIYGHSFADGSHQWTVATDDQVNSTPAVYDGKCFAGGCDSFVHVIDVAKGERINSYGFPEYLPTAVTVVGGVIYAPYGNPSDAMIMAAYDMEQDKIIWEFEADAALKTVSAVDDKHVVFGGDDYFVTCLDKQTGKKIWSYETGDMVSSSPVIADGKVVVGSDDGKVYMLSLTDGKVIWSYNAGPSVTASPVVHDGSVYVGDAGGTFYRFAAAE